MSAATILSRAARDALRRLGEQSYFNGAADPTWIVIERGVQLTGIGSDEAAYRGTHVAASDLATIHHDDGPATGKTFVQAGATYKLGALVNDNGFTKTYAVMKVA